MVERIGELREELRGGTFKKQLSRVNPFFHTHTKQMIAHISLFDQEFLILLTSQV